MPSYSAGEPRLQSENDRARIARLFAHAEGRSAPIGDDDLFAETGTARQEADVEALLAEIPDDWRDDDGHQSDPTCASHNVERAQSGDVEHPVELALVSAPKTAAEISTDAQAPATTGHDPLSLAPGCYGMGLTYQEPSAECRLCPFAATCAPKSATILEWLRATGCKSWEETDREAARKRQARCRERKRPAVPVKRGRPRKPIAMSSTERSRRRRTALKAAARHRET
jgi:hypothetical protein